MRRIWIFLVVGLTAVLITLFLYFGYPITQPAAETAVSPPVTIPVSQGDVEQTVTAPGQLVSTQDELLSLEVGGRLRQLNVRPGTIVQAGDVLAEVDPNPYAVALTEARLRLKQAQAEQQQAVATAELTVADAETGVSQAQAQFPAVTAAELRLQTAVEAEQRAAVEYDKAVNRPWEPDDVTESYRLGLVAAQRERAVAESELTAVRNQQWAAGEAIASRRTQVEQANLTLNYLQENGIDPLLALAVSQAEADFAATKLVAPFDGVVLDVLVQPGETLAAGQGVLLLTDPTRGEVRTTVIEEDLPLTQLGQTAEIFFDAQPEIGVQGTVARIVPRRVVGEERPLYHVYLTLNDPIPPGVFPGMTADAAIIIARHRNVLRLPRALVPTRADGTATVTLWQNGQEQPRTVTVGLRGDAYVEIVDGLEVGDEVVAE